MHIRCDEKPQPVTAEVDDVLLGDRAQRSQRIDRLREEGVEPGLDECRLLVAG